MEGLAFSVCSSPATGKWGGGSGKNGSRWEGKPVTPLMSSVQNEQPCLGASTPHTWPCQLSLRIPLNFRSWGHAVGQGWCTSWGHLPVYCGQRLLPLGFGSWAIPGPRWEEQKEPEPPQEGLPPPGRPPLPPVQERVGTGLPVLLDPGTLHLPRLQLGVVPQLLLMICSCFSARSARSRSSSMNCCRRTLALASRAAVSFRNWSIWITSLQEEAGAGRRLCCTWKGQAALRGDRQAQPRVAQKL